jgi:hypothetical protein
MKRELVKERGRVVDHQEIEADPGVSDKRLLAFAPEMASLLRVMARDGNTLSPILREAWDTGTLRTLTKNAPAQATGAHIAILAHIGRDELRVTLDRTDAGNGFGNRFLWLAVRRSQCLPDGGRPVDLAPIVVRIGDALTFARRTGELRRDGEASELWTGVYRELSDGQPGLYGAVTSRAEAQVLRLSLVYALLDLSDSIRLPHLEAALALWGYCADSARYVFGDAIGEPIADAILRTLRANGDKGLTRTEIRDLFDRHRKSEEVDRSLSKLERLGRARSEMEQTGGRPVERWYAGRHNKGSVS